MRPRRTFLRLECLEERSLLAANASGIVQGVVFIDGNGNGIQDRGELPVAGQQVTLAGTTFRGNTVSAQTTTDAGGAYRFLNVLTGTYHLTTNPNSGLFGRTFFGSLGGPEGVNVAGIAVGDGQIVSQNLGFRGQAPSFPSLRQFLSSSPTESFPSAPAGSGSTLVNYRENNRPFLEAAIADFVAGKNSPDTIIDLAGHFSDRDFTNSTVRFVTSEGSFDVGLYDRIAPRSVANFFNYVQSNKYDNSIFHRLVDDFVIQGGGFNFRSNPSTLPGIVSDGTVKNEFRVSNARGTLTYAKVGGNPDSATSQFFFNLKDNNRGTGVENLDTQNGGFTVFGRVVSTADRDVVDALASYQVRDFSGGSATSPFSEVPIRNFSGSNFPGGTTANNYALIQDVQIVNRDEFLTYSVVANSNAGVVTPRIVNNRLVLDYVKDATGTSQITVRATDRFGASVDTSFTVRVNNRAPTATVTLAPSAPQTDAIVTATATRSDIDGDTVNLTYVWKVNDIVREVVRNSTSLTSTFDLGKDGNGNTGDRITVEVTPNDGTVSGATVSATVTVA